MSSISSLALRVVDMARSIKKGSVVVAVGTKKGGFLFHSPDRKKWSVAGPFIGGRGRLSHDAGPAGRSDRLRVRPDGQRAMGTGDLSRPRRGGTESDAGGPEVQGGFRSKRVP